MMRGHLTCHILSLLKTLHIYTKAVSLHQVLGNLRILYLAVSSTGKLHIYATTAGSKNFI